MLQEVEDNYYITAKYLLELANRAYELFESSEVEERRQLIKLVPQNLRVEGKKVRYDGIKPFDTILNYADNQLWLTTPPLTLYQIFNRETIAKVRIQLEVARKLANNPLAYQIVEVTNGRFCQLPVPA